VCASSPDHPQPGEPLTTSAEMVYAAAQSVLVDRLRSLERSGASNEAHEVRRRLVAALPDALTSGDLTAVDPLAFQIGALAQRQGLPLAALVAVAHHNHTQTMDAIIGHLDHTDHAGLVALLRISHVVRDLSDTALAGYQDAALALLTEQALTDGLTGIANRRAFDIHLDDEIQRGRRFGHGVALVLVDIDGLKRVNDTQGHIRGDLLVCAVATILREQARGIDLVARIGGDEFAVILPEATRDGADALIQRLMQTANTRQVDGAAVRFSVGVAVYPGDGTTPAALIDHADQHMYADKRHGRTDA